MKDYLTNLKLDLSFRKDETYYGSGLGGNYNQFLFLLQNSIITKPSINEVLLFEEDGSDIILSLPDKVAIKDLRQNLDMFYLNSTLYKKEIIQGKQLLDLKFLNDLDNKTNDSKLFLQGVKDILQLKNEVLNSNGSIVFNQDIINRVKLNPSYINLFIIRVSFGVEMIVKYDLDNHLIFQSILLDINKTARLI